MADRLNIEWFDVEGWLSSKGIHYDTEGKNVQKGWIAINCPWCDDPSNHLGIDLRTKGMSCFRCPIKGTVIKIVMKISQVDFESAKAEIQNFTHRSLSIIERSSRETRIPNSDQQVILPSHDAFSFDQHFSYLLSRNFDPDYIIHKYGISFSGPIGDYRMRIVVPIYQQRRLVSFTTRDVTGRQRIPWLHGKPEHVIATAKSCLYNIDTVQETAIIVEGVTDVWRLGDGVIGTFGDKWTERHVYLCRNLKRGFVLFDSEPEAQENAERLAYNMSSFVPEIHIYELEEGDPGDLSQDDVLAIRSEIFGRKFF